MPSRGLRSGQGFRGAGCVPRRRAVRSGVRAHAALAAERAYAGLPDRAHLSPGGVKRSATPSKARLNGVLDRAIVVVDDVETAEA